MRQRQTATTFLASFLGLILAAPAGAQVCATPGRDTSASRAASLNAWSGGNTSEAERTR